MSTHGKSDALNDCLGVSPGDMKYTLGVVMSYLVEQGLQLLGTGLFRPDPDTLAATA